METFFIVNIKYILSLAYIDVIVPYNVSDVWEFDPLGLYSALERQWVPKHMYYLVSGPQSFGSQPL